ncbi:MAG: exonuclease SbcCD subunit D [Spirochaetaceae bacterium]|nr:exonuclease SbcCD subunit D [Spirochaetaceae bacterium]
MRILHASDLHLGKTLHERGLLEDQARMLECLLEAIATERPAALLLAGDIYDRGVPPPEAIGLFDSFLNRAASLDPELAIVVVPGNHDSASRLSFGAGLLRRAGVHFRTRAEEAAEPVMVEREGEALAVFALPYLNPGSLRRSAPRPPAATGSAAAAPEPEFDFGTAEEAAPLRSQAELFEEALRRVTPRLVRGAHNVLLAHCFAAGCSSSESERAFVGAAELVDAAAFDPFDYAALGHLHRPQAAGRKGRYPGSPLAYAFSEGEAGDRGFLLVDLASGGFEARLLPAKPLRRLRRVTGSFAELSAPGALPEARGDYVEARLTDELPVLDPADALRANFPHLLSVRQAAFEIKAAGTGGAGAEAGPRSAETGAAAAAADFEAFHLELRGEPPDPETRALFTELLAEAERAAL